MKSVLLVTLVLAVLVIVVLRWRSIHSGSGAFRCAMVTPRGTSGDRWKISRGTGRYGTNQLLWWRDWSAGLQPTLTWRRDDLNIVQRQDCPRGCTDTYVVTLEAQNQRYDFEMSKESYAGLTSWLEATPLKTDWVL